MSTLKFDQNFENFIYDSSSRCRVVDIIKKGGGIFLKRVGDYIKVENHLMISYIPKNKLEFINSDEDGFSNGKYRSKMRIGRFVSKFIREDVTKIISDYDNEVFVNIFKSYFDTSNLFVVEGEDILKYYNQESYLDVNGGLWQSCMRYPEKNSYMKIYSENPNKIKMLIQLTQNGKLRSRALLWTGYVDTNGNIYNVMDRIYTIYDHDITLFKKWASENGYYHKYEQSSKSRLLFVRPEDGEVVKLFLKIELDNVEMKKYPYVDTFRYLSLKDKSLTNTDSYYKWEYILIQNHGGLEPEDDESGDEIDFGYEYDDGGY
jgi:hypothetical protein